MKYGMDVKSMIVGGLLVAGLLLLAGAAGNKPAGMVGRFQIATADSAAYLVDTATGQVWYSGRISSESDAAFKSPKLNAERRAMVEGPTGFIGKWRATTPDHEDLGIRIEPGGRCVATDDQKTYEGQWRVEGDRIIITVDNDTVTGQLDAEGRLMLCEGDGDDQVPFVRVE